MSLKAYKCPHCKALTNEPGVVKSPTKRIYIECPWCGQIIKEIKNRNEFYEIVEDRK